MFFKKKKSFDEYVDEAYANEDVVLLDVRSQAEFQEGHLKGSNNLPLDVLEKIKYQKETPLYVYCYSGSRSQMAVRQLQHMGYTQVVNIGGISKTQKSLQRGR